MKTTTALLLTLIILMPGNSAACTMVYGNGWQGCAETPEREPVWHDRWGAVATDGSTGAFGAAYTVSGRDNAVKKAIKQCTKNKGKNCEIRLIYRNECASMVSGKEWDFFQSAPTTEDAESIAMRRCEGKDIDCNVVYTRCSHGFST